MTKGFFELIALTRGCQFNSLVDCFMSLMIFMSCGFETLFLSGGAWAIFIPPTLFISSETGVTLYSTFIRERSGGEGLFSDTSASTMCCSEGGRAEDFLFLMVGQKHFFIDHEGGSVSRLTGSLRHVHFVSPT